MCALHFYHFRCQCRLWYWHSLVSLVSRINALLWQANLTVVAGFSNFTVSVQTMMYCSQPTPNHHWEKPNEVVRMTPCCLPLAVLWMQLSRRGPSGRPGHAGERTSYRWPVSVWLSPRRSWRTLLLCRKMSGPVATSTSRKKRDGWLSKVADSLEDLGGALFNSSVYSHIY